MVGVEKRMGRGMEGGRAAKDSYEKGPKSRHSVWEGSNKKREGGRDGGQGRKVMKKVRK